MNRLVSILCFLFFFVGFFMAELFRFDLFIHQQNHSLGVLLLIVGLAVGSGILLFLALRAFQLLPLPSAQRLIYGGVFGFCFFFAIFLIEDIFSDKKLGSSTVDFSEVRGHCGIYAGRALEKMVDTDWIPSPASLVQDYRVSSRCRIDHFLTLQKKQKIRCADGDDEVQCRVKWMAKFSEKGFWGPETRRMFLKQILDLWNGMKSGNGLKINEDSWVEYALKDHELETGNPDLLQQAGVDEQFSDDYLYFKQKDELENLKVSQSIFEEVSKMMTEGGRPTPAMMRFRDAEREMKPQFEQIPQMEIDIQALEKKLSYNPSR